MLDREPADCPTVALADDAVCNRRLHGFVEVEESERVGYRGSSTADPFGEVLLREPELIDELPIRPRRFEGIEVLALEVLHEGKFELLPIRKLADDRRDPFQARRSGCADPSLAGDELVAVEGLGNQDGLDHTVLADARRKRLHGRVVHPEARLSGIGPDPIERDVDGS
jgi:hypothetical protein